MAPLLKSGINKKTHEINSLNGIGDAQVRHGALPKAAQLLFSHRAVPGRVPRGPRLLPEVQRPNADFPQSLVNRSQSRTVNEHDSPESNTLLTC
jgi:hypothetical protein